LYHHAVYSRTSGPNGNAVKSDADGTTLSAKPGEYHAASIAPVEIASQISPPATISPGLRKIRLTEPFVSAAMRGPMFWPLSPSKGSVPG
jgi:hypothetical protein